MELISICQVHQLRKVGVFDRLSSVIHYFASHINSYVCINMSNGYQPLPSLTLAFPLSQRSSLELTGNLSWTELNGVSPPAKAVVFCDPPLIVTNRRKIYGIARYWWCIHQCKSNLERRRSSYEQRWCLVTWDTICTPRGQGGLGVHNLQHFNFSLLATYLLFGYCCSPWVQIVIHNYYIAAFHLGYRVFVAG